MKAKLLEYLQQADSFLSGQELCRHFGVSRTAVWKAIRSLEEDGFVIEAVRNKGYRLIEAPDILTKESCKSRIHTEWAGQYLEAYDEIDTTNRRVKQLGEEGAPHGALVVADCQTAGKGRRGRSWITPAGSALAFSLLLRPSLSPDRVSMITLVSALAVSSAIDELTGLSTSIKWPNDIVYEKKKLCGILTEMSTELESIHYVVVGIGINVHVREFPQELTDKATSLALITGKSYNRSQLLGLVMKYFEEYYTQFELDQDLRNLKQKYESKLAGKGSVVSIVEKDRERRGTCLGITDMGALRIAFDDGGTEEIISGEVSVRGIYGYI